MKRAIILAGLLMAGNAHGSEAVKLCETRWPDDYRMQEHCIDEQKKALGELSAWIERWGKRDGPEKIIVGKCGSRWGVDFPMTAHCVKEETAAYDRLHPTEMIEVMK